MHEALRQMYDAAPADKQPDLTRFVVPSGVKSTKIVTRVALVPRQWMNDQRGV